MKAAILGAAGIGKYHAKNLVKTGCDVVAILDRSRQDAQRTALMLKNQFGLTVTPYHDINELFTSETIDIVSVCVPTPLHEPFVTRCLESKVHVFCEKPLLDGGNLYTRAAGLFKQAKDKNVLLNVNMQWAYLPSLIPHGIVQEFEICMEPGEKGESMLVDQLCHATSMLQKLVPNGTVKNIRIERKSEKSNNVSFEYVTDQNSCNVRYKFAYKKDQPRAFVFSINGKKYHRKIGKNYEQSFVCDDQEYTLEDPFMVSISRFVSAVKGVGSPLLSEKEILHNLQLQEEILRVYASEAA